MPLAIWVHDFDPFLIRFSENFGIRYYGIAYLLGFLAAAGLLVLYHRRGRSPLGFNAVTDLMTALVFGVLVGGRLGYFFLYQLDTFRADPLALFRVWEGGMASHGGFLGVVVALWWWSRRQQTSLLHAADLIVTTAPAGLFFGRIANFINGELVGKITTVSWAVIFPHNEIDRHLVRPFPRHPSQLYQAALEGAVLLAYLQWRFWRASPSSLRPGQLSGEFLIGYAVLRMVGEHFREPDAPLLFGLSRGTFYSFFLILAGAYLLIRARRQSGPRTTPGGEA
ncbi:MAG: prolipoprotein diacylglyceryl transferase [Verrucomicrobia bacterium]|nr:prolipoprotein diacylglyceryl transferase [Verrucomicrobiota bacterium]